MKSRPREMDKILKALSYMPMSALVPLYWISFLIPKKRDLWVFGSWFGNKFADNSKYLFLYVAKKHPEIRPVWLTRSKGVMDELRAQGFECHHAYGIKGFFYSIMASKVVMSVGRWDVNRFAIGGAETIQLWHGTPLKKIGYDDKITLRQDQRKGLLARLRESLFPFNNFDRSDMYMVPSAEVAGIFSSAFRVPPSRMIITGYPRNDRLFKYGWACLPGDSGFIEGLRARIKFKKVFLYLPTHRGEGKKSLDLFEKHGFDAARMEKTLEALDAILICKTHFYNRPERDFTVTARILFPSDDDLPDIYPLLGEADVLLTDYSSIYFDFLLLDRPMVFTPFDLSEYLREDRELYYDYDSVTPGPKARNWNEVEAWLKEVSSKDEYRNARSLINSRFNMSAERPFAERVFEAIASLAAQCNRLQEGKGSGFGTQY